MPSPTSRLLAGLAFTLLVICGYAFYTLRAVAVMREVQSSVVERNRLGSLQLIRIQNELNSLGLAIRDMLDDSAQYPLHAWAAPLLRVRTNLEDAIAREAQLSGGRRSPQQTAFLNTSFLAFWQTCDEVIALSRQGNSAAAESKVRNNLQPQLQALGALTARLLVSNNDEGAKASSNVVTLYGEIERNAYIFLGLSLALIVLTSLGLIRFNRNLFDRLTSLADQRRELAQQLISSQESTFRAISRDLHDEFGQILTALGAMLRRATIREHVQEAMEIVQNTLEKIRSLSQALQPVILEEQGLIPAIAWHIAGFERHTGITVNYTQPNQAIDLPPMKAIHVFRILQEALNNAARHSGASQIDVELEATPYQLKLAVTDHGQGIKDRATTGIGITGMRERAAILGATFSIATPPNAGGTQILLTVPHGV